MHALKNTHPTRAPAHIECAGGKSKRQRVWEAIRVAGDGWTTDSIAKASGMDATAVRTYLSALKAGGYITAVPDQTRIHRHTLIKDVGIDAPRINRRGSPITLGLAQQQMWQTLRITGQAFSPDELSGLASTPRVPVSPAAAAGYLGHLRRAGYLVATAKGRYRLIKNTGPRAPMVQRTKSVYDPNQDVVMQQKETVNVTR